MTVIVKNHGMFAVLTLTLLQDCDTEFEKKCRIVLRPVETNETVTRCSRPLQRRCGDQVLHIANVMNTN